MVRQLDLPNPGCTDIPAVPEPVRPCVDDSAGHGEHTFGSSSGLYVSAGQAER